MSKRELGLVIAVGFLALVAGGYFLWNQVADGFETRQQTISSVDDQLHKAEVQRRRGVKASRKIKTFREQSMPPNMEIARSVYKTWLLKLVTSNGFKQPDVTSLDERAVGREYRQLAFRVRGDGTVEQVVTFLHQFYATNRLHRIGHLVLNPKEDEKSVGMVMRIDTLALPKATHTEDLNQEPSERLARADVQEYVERIAGRNLFAPANEAPKLNSVGELKAVTGKDFSHQLKASDSNEDDKLTYKLVGEVPSGAKIDAATGKVSWKPESAGEFTFKCAVHDNGVPQQEVTTEFKVVVEKAKQSNEDAKNTKISGIFDGEERVVVFQNSKTGQRAKAAEGEDFELGDLKGTVLEIGLRDVIIRLGDESVRAFAGIALSDAKPIDEAPVKEN